MSNINQIVQVQISQQTQAVPQAGFGIPLIVGPSNRFLNSDVVRYYSSLSGMLADGFLTSDPEYVYASEALGQALAPELIGIGKRTAAVTQIDTVTVNTVSAGHTYSVTINAVPFTYVASGGDTADVILEALKVAIDAGSQPVNAVHNTGPHTLVISSTQIGLGFSTIVDADLTLVHSTPNHGISDDLQAIINQSNLWYGLAICSNADADILEAASFIETVQKIFIAVSNDAAIATTSTSDLASVLKGKGYKRTALMYSPTSFNLGMEAAWLGGLLPTTPGAATWKFKQLVGIVPDVFTDNVRTILIGVPGVPGKNVNIYETVGGANITEEGMMVGGQFIDVTIGIDWLQSTMQVNVFANLVNLPKIPYTDQGVAVVEGAIRQTILEGVSNGLIDGKTGFTVNAPLVLDVPANDRAERLLPDVTFTARLAGALHFIQIQGVVTV